jgi:hypothetical protein
LFVNISTRRCCVSMPLAAVYNPRNKGGHLA